jgi:putative membrane protein
MSRTLALALVLSPLLAASAHAQVPTATTPAAPDDLVNSADVRTEVESLTDGKIIEITHVANTAEIAQAKLALLRSLDPSVRRLARTIVTDHQKADHAGARVAEQNRLVLAESGISKRLQTDADKTLTDLNGKSDADFDRAYVDAQIDQHKSVLRLIDEKLTASANSSAVKSLLATVRPHIQMHLDRSKAIKATMKNERAER